MSRDKRREKLKCRSDVLTDPDTLMVGNSSQRSPATEVRRYSIIEHTEENGMRILSQQYKFGCSSCY